jgi:glycosyltransferase involved in cell wall biosynthesis
MMQTPRVSFIVPVCNRSVLLRAALASCLAQTIEAWEAIVVDDHSEEPIAEVVGGFHDSRLRYLRQHSHLRGVAAARETAIAQARSSILITMDADDLSHPHRAARCLELLADGQPRLIYTRVRLFSAANPAGRPKPLLHPYQPLLFTRFNFITNPGTAFNLGAYRAAGASYDHGLAMAEDYDLYLRMAQAGVEIRAVDEEHVSYRKAAQSTTAGRAEDLHAAIMKVRRNNGIPPFPLEAIAAEALPELWATIAGDPAAQRLWRDDRWLDCHEGA